MKVIYAEIIPLIKKVVDDKPRPIKQVELNLEEAEAFHTELRACGEEAGWIAFKARGRFFFYGVNLVWPTA